MYKSAVFEASKDDPMTKTERDSNPHGAALHTIGPDNVEKPHTNAYIIGFYDGPFLDYGPSKMQNA